MSRNGYPTNLCPNVAATSHVTYSRTLWEIVIRILAGFIELLISATTGCRIHLSKLFLISGLFGI